MSKTMILKKSTENLSPFLNDKNANNELSKNLLLSMFYGIEKNFSESLSLDVVINCFQEYYCSFEEKMEYFEFPSIHRILILVDELVNSSFLSYCGEIINLTENGIIEGEKYHSILKKAYFS